MKAPFEDIILHPPTPVESMSHRWNEEFPQKTRIIQQKKREENNKDEKSR
jgi:hypothetical protein